MTQRRTARAPVLPLGEMMLERVDVDSQLDHFFANGGTQKALVEQINAHGKSRGNSFGMGRMNGTLAKLLARVGDFSACSFPVVAYAVDFSDMELFELAIARGADVEHAESKGAPPIVIAARVLVEETFSAMRQGLAESIIAIAKQRAETARKQLRALIRAGADVNLPDPEGRTALMQCVRGCHLDEVAVLIEAGARVNAGDKDGVTALHEAVTLRIDGDQEDESYRARLQTLKLLLRNGGDPNARTFSGDTPLHHFVWPRPAIPARWAKRFLETLLDSGAKLETRNSTGHTPLLTSVASDVPRVDLTVTEVLLEFGANIRATDRAGVAIDKLGEPEMQRLVRALLAARNIESAMGGVEQGSAPRQTGFTL